MTLLLRLSFLLLLLISCRRPSVDRPPTPTQPAIAAPAATPTPNVEPANTPKIESLAVEPALLADPAWRQLGPGDRFDLSWDASGGRVTLCIDERCREVVNRATERVTFRSVDPVADHWVDIRLSVAGAHDYAEQTLRVYPRCHYQWPQPLAAVSDACPTGPPDVQTVQAQRFENGWMFTNSDTVSALIDDAQPLLVEVGRGDLQADQPAASEAGAGAPATAFRRVWAGAVAGAEQTGELLGGAVGPMFAFERVTACERRPPESEARCFEVAPDGRIAQRGQVEQMIVPPNHPDGYLVAITRVSWLTDGR